MGGILSPTKIIYNLADIDWRFSFPLRKFFVHTRCKSNARNNFIDRVIGYNIFAIKNSENDI